MCGAVVICLGTVQYGTTSRRQESSIGPVTTLGLARGDGLELFCDLVCCSGQTIEQVFKDM